MDVNLANPISSLIDFGRDVVDRIFPDKTVQLKERAEAESHVLELAQARFQATLQATTATDVAQADVNKIEAGAPGWFKGGWRPAIGWVGALALFVYYVPYCVAATVMWVIQCARAHELVARPNLDISDLIALITILLGASTQRMLERLKGVS